MIDGVDRVIDCRMYDGQIARRKTDRRFIRPYGGQDGLVPLKHCVGREQLAPFQRLHAYRARPNAAGALAKWAGWDGTAVMLKSGKHGRLR